MSRPYQIWFAFAVCLAVGVGAMAWLTLKACELDRAEANARQQAELEESIGRALWRMDTRLAPILAEEAARPSIVYQAILEADAKVAQAPNAVPKFSPLLVRPSEFALLNFQLLPDNIVTSPQCVAPNQTAWAAKLGVTKAALTARLDHLKVLQGSLRFDQILDQLPEDTLPDVVDLQLVNEVAGRGPVPSSGKQNEERYVANQNVELAQSQRAVAEQNESANQQAPNLPTPNVAQNPTANNSFKSRSANPNYLNQDLQSRSQGVQQFAKIERLEQSKLAAPPDASAKSNRPLPREGVSRPMWIGSQLVLARRVTNGSQVFIQGCWLDWPKLKQTLIDEVRDLLPQVDLEPLTEKTEVKLGRLLATLPVQLVVPAATAVPDPWSPIRVSLAFAWGALLVVGGAVALLLQGVLTLSERRGAFVSAVTHELRTPLTTFRMYAEMLAGGMVPPGEQQQQYLETLQVEADRLSHLVENVLQYARLERGRPGHRRELVTVAEILNRVEARLAQRTAQAGMKLVVEAEPTMRAVSLKTDPSAVEQILFNLVDNACKYAVAADDRRIHVQFETQGSTLVCRVRDHGPGISAKSAKKLFRPFSKSVHEAANSAPGVGLGLALSQRLASDLGGSLRLDGEANTGATFELTLPLA